jgi:hypothetical protein
VSDELERATAALAAAREAQLDDAERRRFGVVHTPPPLARFVARSVDEALRTFGRAGLADPDVALVDPACGPSAFLAACLASASSGRPRVALGLDRDAAAIDGARALLEGPARLAGWPLRLAALDTLAESDVLRPEERDGATLVVLGNPPWAVRSASRGEPLSEAWLEDFRRDAEGARLRERKLGVLSDAYVRFWRWSCELARRSDAGAVVALVTNASFLDGPVHRGMRAALERWFARIDVVHLGGSGLVARRGDRDENVFGVRPAAAITLAVRSPCFAEASSPRASAAALRHAALRGTREEKLTRLEEAETLARIGLEPITAGGPWVPAARADTSYARWPSLPELMPFHREGLQSNRDAFCVDVDRAALVERVRAFARGAPGPWPARADVASEHYDPQRARQELRSIDLEAHVQRVAYRPFDERWMCVSPAVCHRPRPDLLAAMARSDLALLTVRQDRGERGWAHFGVTRTPPDNCFLSTRSSCRTRAFPTHGPDGAVNLDLAALAAWTVRLEALPAVHEVVRYALAVLASSTYRARFDAALRADYPRLPPPPSQAAWDTLVAAGVDVERAFERPAASQPFELGHHRLDCAGALEAAVRAADEAVRVLLLPSA